MPDLRNLAVLVVDDDEDTRALLRRFFEAEGIRQIDEAVDGASGLNALSNTRYDMILTDLVMTPMDGLEFARQVRAARNTHSQVPIIMITAHDEEQRIVAARNAGVNELLVKPIKPEHLVARVCDILENPRPFVWTESYFGPDRRRSGHQDYEGSSRRG